MNKRAQYICFEGTEGVGKTTQTQLLVDTLRARGFTVLQTKEPGTSHIPLTMTLRGIMLDNQYDDVLTRPAREFISQAIRSIHIEKLIAPSLDKYDYIVQDRGILSGLAYGGACDNDFSLLNTLANEVVTCATPYSLYDRVIYLKGDLQQNLAKAKTSKQEFETGDAMESRGTRFHENVQNNMDIMSKDFWTTQINVTGKTIQEVHDEILTCLGLGI